MIKIGFELEVDEGACVPSPRELTQALQDALPKEWWVDHREADWGVTALYALNDDGTPQQADHRLRPKDWEKEAGHWKTQFDALIAEDRGYERKIEKLEALLAQERRLTKHLDGILYEKNRQVEKDDEEVAKAKQLTESWETTAGILKVENGHLRHDLGRAEGLVDDLQYEIGGLRKYRDELKKLVDHRTDQVNAFTVMVDDQEAIVKQLVKRAEVAEHGRIMCEQQIDRQVGDMNRKDTAIVGLHETISSLESEVRVITDDADTWMGRYDDCSHVSAKQKVRIDKLGKEIQDLVAEASKWKRKAAEAKVDKWFHADQAVGQSLKIQELEAKLVEFEKEVYDQGQRIEDLLAQTAEAEEQYSTVDVDDLFNSIGDLGTELEQQKVLLRERDRQVEDLADTVVQRDVTISAKRADIKYLRGQVDSLARKVDARDRAIEDQADAIDNLTKKNGNQFEIIKQFQDDMELLSATVDKQADKYVALQHENGELRVEITAKKEWIGSLDKAIAMKQVRIENLRRRLVEAYGDIDGWGDDAQLTKIETAFEHAKGYVESANGETDTALAYLDDLGAMLDEIRTGR